MPVKSVYFEVQNGTGEMVKVKNNANFAMKEGENTGLVCVAFMDGTEEPAEIDLRLGRKDVTSMFDITNHPQVIELNDHFETASNKATASYLTMYPDKKFDGKKLTCRGTSLSGYQEEAHIFLSVFCRFYFF